MFLYFFAGNKSGNGKPDEKMKMILQDVEKVGWPDEPFSAASSGRRFGQRDLGLGHRQGKSYAPSQGRAGSKGWNWWTGGNMLWAEMKIEVYK